MLLQFLNPIGRDIVNFKLVCSHCKELVDKVVALHHIISIFYSILNNDPHIPSLQLPSNFLINPSHFQPFGLRMIEKLQQEHFLSHIVTRFILLFHNHPMCTQFLQLCHNSVFLLQLAGEGYFPESPLFQQLRTILRLQTILEQSELTGWNEYIMNSQWLAEKEWNAAFVTPHTIYTTVFATDVEIPNDEVLINGIITNKELLLFLLQSCTEESCLYLVSCLFSHFKWKEYKTDERVQIILIKSNSGELVGETLAKELSLAECTNVEYLCRLLYHNGLLLQYFNLSMRKNKKVVMKAMQNFWYAHNYAAKEVEMDKNIIREVSKSFGYDKVRANTIMKYYAKDEEFLKELALLNSRNFYQHFDWTQHKEEALLAVTKSSSIFVDSLHKFWCIDREVVLAAVKVNGMALKYANEKLKQDGEIVTAALCNNVLAISYVPAFKENKDVILKVVKQWYFFGSL